MTTTTPTKSTELHARPRVMGLDPWADLVPWTMPMRELMQQLWPSWPTADFSPGGELLEKDDAFVLELDLPGVDKKDVSIDVSGRRLQIRGTKTVKEKDGVLRHSTRSSGTFSYELALPVAVQEASATATLADGVLTVTMPKATTVPTTRVDIV